MESGNCERRLSGTDKIFSIQNKTLYSCLLYIISCIDIFSNRNLKIINVVAVIHTHRNLVQVAKTRAVSNVSKNIIHKITSDARLQVIFAIISFIWLDVYNLHLKNCWN
jgi:hypothetical protein